MNELYKTLRNLVSDKYKIRITDGNNPKVSITPDNYEDHPWISFSGETIEDSLKRAIKKLKNPELDYLEKPSYLSPKGHLWKANGRSTYSEDFTRLFLSTRKEDQ